MGGWREGRGVLIVSGKNTRASGTTTNQHPPPISDLHHYSVYTQKKWLFGVNWNY